MATAKILIVEDESIVAFNIQNRLEGLGYTVTAISPSGEGALQIVAQNCPDLVLMDIKLKGSIDGIEAAAQIRNHFHIPVVYLTAYTDEETLNRAKLTQPYGYILKPFEARDLCTTIEVALYNYQVEQQRKEREVLLALAKEQELNELKSRIIATVSHEYRTPLTTILSSIELLEKYSSTWADERKHKHFQRIHASITYLTKLVNNMLFINQAEAGSLTFEPAPLNLEQITCAVVEELQLNDRGQHTIIFECQGDCTNTVLDKALLESMLRNLLSNAIKYSPQGSIVRFDLTAEQNAVVFCISDQGIGIPASEQAEIFNAFFRGSNVGTAPGVGLGLVIVKECVDLHGGKVVVDSEVGTGTTFTVTLPLPRRLTSV